MYTVQLQFESEEDAKWVHNVCRKQINQPEERVGRLELAILIDSLRKAKTVTLQGVAPVSAKNACINNLRLIDSGKQQWALEQQKTAADTPAWSDLPPYLGRGPNGELPSCPSGGTYTIGAVGEKPQCNTAEHALP